ncbi:MAG: patatin-like phospholipase family protein, partial [Mesorhizobium sp.]
MNRITRNPPVSEAALEIGPQGEPKRQTVLVLQGGGALGAY